MIYQNFYIKAPVALLKKPIPLADFKKEDGSYMTIPEYLEQIDHTIKRYSNDGYFIKGFGFNIQGLDELRSKLPEFGLTENVNIWILSPSQVLDELEKETWQTN